MLTRLLLAMMILFQLSDIGRSAEAEATRTNVTSSADETKSADDGWLDASSFLDEKYGFLPIALPITEPAVGYGGAGGLMFISKPLGDAAAGFGRPDITMVGGLGTENGSWGALAGDVHHWFDDRVQTIVAAVYASANLDFYGLGRDSRLDDNPLQYNLEPKGGLAQAKYRVGDSPFWLGLSYAFASTDIHLNNLNTRTNLPGLPDFAQQSNEGGLTALFTWDTRDNIFTPLRGTYAELTVGAFSQALGGDDEFERLHVVAMQYVPLGSRFTLGMRGDLAASFGDEPFYLRPFISLRGVPALRYQGEEMAQIETELRWQFWKRFSLVGFMGAGEVWNHRGRFENNQTVVTGGTGFRYEIARKYGIHLGVDVAFAPENTAVYFQVGSAWARP